MGRRLKGEGPDQHFHLLSDYKGAGGVGDIEIAVQTVVEPSNMMTTGKALAPGSTIPDPNQPPEPTSDRAAHDHSRLVRMFRQKMKLKVIPIAQWVVSLIEYAAFIGFGAWFT